MQTPEQFPPAEEEPFYEAEEEVYVRPATGFWSIGSRLTWIAGLVLTISAFTDWYAGPNTTDNHRRAYIMVFGYRDE